MRAPALAPLLLAACADGSAAECGNIYTRGQEVYRDADQLVYAGNDDSRPDHLGVQFFFSRGAIDGPSTVILNDDDWATCAACVFVTRGETRYQAHAGTIDVQASGEVGARFEAQLYDLEFSEVEFSGSNTAVVPSGESFCILAQGIRGTIQAL